MSLDVEVIPGAALGDVADAWNALAARDPLATPFQSADWAAAWLGHWKRPGEAWIVAVRDGGELRGIVPVTVSRRGGVRVLGMLGKEPGDYWDVVAADADRTRVAEMAARELRRRRGSWDVGLLSCLDPGSGTVDGLVAGGLRAWRRAPVPSPRIVLPDTFDAYLGILPAKHRNNLRRHLRRLDRGDLGVRSVTDPDEIPRVLDHCHELRRRQWAAAGRTLSPVNAEPFLVDFMAAVAVRLVARGQATLWEFRHDGAVAGIYLNFHDAEAFYWYLGGFAPDMAGLGVGKVAIGLGIRESIAAGRRAFDFTRGSEPYKYWYGATDRELQSVVLGHGGVRSRAALAATSGILAARERRALRAAR